MDQRANFLALMLLENLEDENEKAINTLLDKYQADASFVPQARGISALHYVCGMPNNRLAEVIIRKFLACGANPNVLSDEGLTPLHVASIYGRVDIVKQLLEHGARLDLYDENGKLAVHYAIEECHFDIFQVLRDHIFEGKFKRKQQDSNQSSGLTSEQTFERSLQQRAKSQASTPKEKGEKPKDQAPKHCINKNLLTAFTANNTSKVNESMLTPNKVHYNYDVTSPYYIYITHRRHNPQPVYPANNSRQTGCSADDESTPYSIEYCPKKLNSEEPESVNIFTLTKQNVEELSTTLTAPERSRLSMIEIWREKVQRSRTRHSTLQEFDNLNEMIDGVMASEDLNFTNTVLKEKTKSESEAEADSGACGLTQSTADANEAFQRTPSRRGGSMSLGKLIQSISEAQLVEAAPAPANDAESSYHTVPEEAGGCEANSSNFIRSPNTKDFILQMAEAYVHTDNDNGLVFYEKKLLSNPVGVRAREGNGVDLETTQTTQSTNITIPMDYDTDELRAELTTFGEPPGPITKHTKRLYIKRLVKYKRKPGMRLPENDSKQSKFSVELHRTIRSVDHFGNIADFAKLESLSASYFANAQNSKQMREGHLKQSFIYMLIDPRISCNLPGESGFLEKLDIWKRFLHAVFYVGKGKTTRPYSHLYDAMKTHSRLHIQNPSSDQKSKKKLPFKKQPLNVDLFKSPPQKTSDSQKLDRILDIWGTGNGVVCLHVFHNILPSEAYTREAAMIDALSLKHLTNVKRGDYYGPAKTWTMKEKKHLGIALLYKSMQIYLAEGESQLSPSDLI